MHVATRRTRPAILRAHQEGGSCLVGAAYRVLLIPTNRLAETVPERSTGTKAEGVGGTLGVQGTSRLTVGHTCIEIQAAFKTRQFGDQRHQLADRDLEPCA